MSIKTFAAKILGIDLPTARRSQVALRSEPFNVGSDATAGKVQSVIRQAENGDTRQLFALYRDILVGDTHIQTEFSKRKLAVLGNAMNILPADKAKPEDVKAAEACRQMVADCENWIDALTYILDSSLYPVSVGEKIFRPADAGTGLRFTLSRIEPVNYAVLCFRQKVARKFPADPNIKFALDANAEVLPEPWEADLRFYPTDQFGTIQYNPENSYAADPDRHFVHRGHLLVGIRDNWGGPFRSLTFWWLLGVLGREWFARFMERFGSPFIVGRTDSTNKEAVDFLTEALSLSTKIGGLVVDHETEIELKEAMLSGGADAYDKFLGICNREKSKVIVGQELSTTAQPTGMGSGTAKLQGNVRDDIEKFDQIKLGESVEKQLFKQFLRINGLQGAVPKVRWGGLSMDEAKATGELLMDLSSAGLEVTDESVPVVSERVGFELQRKAIAPPTGAIPETFSPAIRHRMVTLSSQVKMADALGVPNSWLNPLRAYIENIISKTETKSLNDQDLLDFLDEAVKRVPELFKEMNTDDLARVFEAGMGKEVVDEVRRGVKQGKV